jgi:hypothetical protein
MQNRFPAFPRLKFATMLHRPRYLPGFILLCSLKAVHSSFRLLACSCGVPAHPLSWYQDLEYQQSPPLTHSLIPKLSEQPQKESLIFPPSLPIYPRPSCCPLPQLSSHSSLHFQSCLLSPHLYHPAPPPSRSLHQPVLLSTTLTDITYWKFIPKPHTLTHPVKNPQFQLALYHYSLSMLIHFTAQAHFSLLKPSSLPQGYGRIFSRSERQAFSERVKLSQPFSSPSLLTINLSHNQSKHPSSTYSSRSFPTNL